MWSDRAHLCSHHSIKITRVNLPSFSASPPKLWTTVLTHSPPFTGSEGLLRCSQEPATKLCPKPVQSNNLLEARLKRTLWPSGWQPWFVFVRSRVQISARRPAILTEVCNGIHNALDKYRECCPKLGHGHFVPYAFQVTIH